MCEYTSAGTVKHLYIYGNYIDEVLFSIGFSKTYYYVHDHLYSPVAIADPNNGAAIERYEYDAYGRCCVLDPNFTIDADGLSDYDNPYLFTGRRWDTLNNSSLKIQYSRNRYYDYHTGRFLTHDPLGITPNPPSLNFFDITDQYKDGLSLYEYVRSNPVVYVDVLGLYPIPLPPPNWDSLESLDEGYDWWDPMAGGSLNCVKPCKWHNNGPVYLKGRSEKGCSAQSISFPTSGVPLVDLAGQVVELFYSPYVSCTAPMTKIGGKFDAGYTCECKWVLARRCKKKCCNRYRGIWEREKVKVVAVLYSYGISEELTYNRNELKFSGCVDPFSFHQEALNAAFGCK